MRYKIIQREGDYEAFLPLELIQDAALNFNPEDEAFLTQLRASCIEYAEVYCNRALCPTEVIMFAEDWRPSIQLPYGDVINVVSVTTLSGENIEYKLNPVTGCIHIDISYMPKAGFFIKYKVGYETPPEALKLAVLRLLTTASENREDIVNGVSATKIDYMTTNVLDLYRLHPCT